MLAKDTLCRNGSLSQRVTALATPRENERDRIAEAEILKPHGFDLETFSKEGKDLCTEAVFYDLHSELQRKTLSLDFIITGFDEKGIGHIRFTNVVTPPQNYDVLGFWAIGSGAHSALASLSHAVEHSMMSRHFEGEKTLYNVLAAKFMSEHARDVGKDTNALILSKGVVRFVHPLGGYEYMRKMWEQEGAPRVPKNAVKVLGDLLFDNVEKSLQEDSLDKISKYSGSAKKVWKTIKGLRKGSK